MHKFDEFDRCLSEVLDNKEVIKLANYKQHGDVTRLNHSINVALKSYKLANTLHFHIDNVSLIRGALLHDFFLYDLKSSRIEKHFVTHPNIALENATKQFELNKVEKDIILKHMWPATHRPPKYKESLIVCIVDTYCAIIEVINYIRRKKRS